MNPNRSIVHFLVAFLLAALSLAAALVSVRIMIITSEARSIPLYYTPGYFPLIVSISLFAALSFEVAKTFREATDRLKKVEHGKILCSVKANAPSIAMAVLLVVYVASFGRVPFVISTPIFLTVAMGLDARRFDRKSIVVLMLGSVALSIALSIIVVYLFRNILFIPIV